MAISRDLRPDPKQKGSYYRRIEDVDRAFDRMKIPKFPPVAAFIANMFSCEKLALAIVGIAKRESATAAFKRKMDLNKIKKAAKILSISISDVELDYIFSARSQESALANHDESHVRSARELRNDLAHDFGPTRVKHIEDELAFLTPKMESFLSCKIEVLDFLKDNYAHIQ